MGGAIPKWLIKSLPLSTQIQRFCGFLLNRWVYSYKLCTTLWSKQFETVIISKPQSGAKKRVF